MGTSSLSTSSTRTPPPRRRVNSMRRRPRRTKLEHSTSRNQSPWQPPWQPPQQRLLSNQPHHPLGQARTRVCVWNLTTENTHTYVDVKWTVRNILICDHRKVGARLIHGRRSTKILRPP